MILYLYLPIGVASYLKVSFSFYSDLFCDLVYSFTPTFFDQTA
jgi:hypothetical protein